MPIVLAAPESISYAQAVLNLGPVGYWRLGETSGTIANNETANNLDGTYFNTPTLGQTGAISGDPDTSVRFRDVSNEFVRIYDPDSLFSSIDDFTICAWVLQTAVPNYNIFSVSDLTYSGLYPKAIWFGQVGGVLHIGMRVTTGGGWTSFSEGFTATSSWKFVVGRRSGSTVHLYVDGIQSTASITVSGTITFPATNTPHISRFWSGSVFKDEWNGHIDEVAWFDKALTNGEISDLYTAGTT